MYLYIIIKADVRFVQKYGVFNNKSAEKSALSPGKSIYSKKNFAPEFLQGKVTIICVDFIKKTV